MTVNYNLDVSNSSPWALVRIMFKWKGSIWKAIWLEYLLWIILFFIVSSVYRYALNEAQQATFKQIAVYISGHEKYIPMDFMLGFFVTNVVNRWTAIFNNIGILDNVSLMAAAHVNGKTLEARLIRRNIVRYCVLAQCIVFRDISMQVRKRFPTLDTVVVGRLMMPHEREKFDSVNDGFAKHWMPFEWAMSLANTARQKGLIDSEIRADTLITEIKNFRTMMATLRNYDWVPLPVMYPQLIFLAIHTYFFLALISRQFIGVNTNEIDLYFPVMTSMQFVFYVGWMKVAEALLNPMGEDDDDFECNWLIDRNLRIGLSIVDEGYGTTPEPMKDDFFENDAQPLYAAGSRAVNPLVNSVANVDVLPHDTIAVEMVPLADPDEVFHDGRSPNMARRLSKASSQRRISVVDLKRQSRYNSAEMSPGMFRNLKRRMSKLGSKPSSNSLKDMNGIGNMAAYYNDDAVSVELAVPSAVTPSSPKRVVFENPLDESHLQPEKKDPNKRKKSDEEVTFPAATSVSNPHEVVSDTINEADDEGDQGSSSRHSSVHSPSHTKM